MFQKKFHRPIPLLLGIYGCFWHAPKGFFALLLFVFFGLSAALRAQELNCQVRVSLPPQLSSALRPQQQENLRRAIENLLNQTTWTQDRYLNHERINCELALTITEIPAPNTYKASAQWLLLRPIYGSDYESILLSYLDRDWNFNYAQSQPLRYNEGSSVDELTGLLAFYAYLLLGLDADSFAPLQGTPYFQQARRIMGLVPSAGSGSWSQFGQLRSRYFLLSNLLDPQFLPLREINYHYHLQGMDKMAGAPDEARGQLFEQVQALSTLLRRTPPSVLANTWLDGKYRELISIFSLGDRAMRSEAYELLKGIDPPRTERYQAIIQN